MSDPRSRQASRSATGESTGGALSTPLALVDTHCHLDLCEGDAASVVQRAREAGVERIATVAIEPAGAGAALELATAHPEVHAIVGCHPNSASALDDAALAQLADSARHARVVAIGETGLDYYRERAPRATQVAAFRAQLELARELQLPVVVHARAASDDTLRVLADHDSARPVVLHCFGMPERVGECIERGYYCSFAGNVTYRNARDLQAAARQVPDELLLAETDAPFLSPQPLRGRPNEPANVAHTVATLAALRGDDPARLARQIADNARRVFGW